jgi:phosphoribosylanthranilate isomerase
MRIPAKICGIRRIEDARLAADLGAAAVGFVFWPASPRFVDPYRARAIVAALPPWVSAIGVFVDQPPDYVAAVAGLVRLAAVQLHGGESVGDFMRPGHRVIKALPVRQGFSMSSVRGLPAGVTVLLDAHDPVRRGGTGATIDWTVAAIVAKERRTILSGGLTADNVRTAIDQVGPAAVDVSSGVESSPGVKDAEKLRAFFAALSE